MDATLDEIADALLNQRLPDNWRKLAPKTCMILAAWLNHLQVNWALFSLFCTHRIVCSTAHSNVISQHHVPINVQPPKFVDAWHDIRWTFHIFICMAFRPQYNANSLKIYFPQQQQFHIYESLIGNDNNKQQPIRNCNQCVHTNKQPNLPASNFCTTTTMGKKINQQPKIGLHICGSLYAMNWTINFRNATNLWCTSWWNIVIECKNKYTNIHRHRYQRTFHFIRSLTTKWWKKTSTITTIH